MNKKVYTVSQINHYLSTMFAQDFLLRRLSMKGEVSNCVYHSTGHIYFTLKDETGVISCVMFAGSRRGLSFRMKNGDKVIVTGSVDVFERDGKYQLYAKEISLEGKGLLYERFLRLREELREMGMFAEEYKQPIPHYIRTLGVVTAPNAAAINDIRTVALRRNPYLQIILYPALVQGEGAAESIIKGIRMLDESDAEVIIIGRGGGSLEELWAFNEESVARAIFECRTPVISAVGHEIDYMIADLVADLRAPTPSAAAELAVDDCRVLFGTIEEYYNRLQYAMESRIQLLRSRQREYQTRLSYLSPENRIREQRQRLETLEEALQRAMEQKLQMEKHTLNLYLEKFQGLSPLKKLQQGFSYVENQEGKCIHSITQVSRGEKLRIQVEDGTIEATADAVRRIEERG